MGTNVRGNFQLIRMFEFFTEALESQERLRCASSPGECTCGIIRVQGTSQERALPTKGTSQERALPTIRAFLGKCPFLGSARFGEVPVIWSAIFWLMGSARSWEVPVLGKCPFYSTFKYYLIKKNTRKLINYEIFVIEKVIFCFILKFIRLLDSWA